jgi:hypothetical protein
MEKKLFVGYDGKAEVYHRQEDIETDGHRGSVPLQKYPGLSF